MTAFRSTAEALLLLSERPVSEAIAEHLRTVNDLLASRSERRSWDRSLPTLAWDLVDAGLGQIEMLIEYQLPLTSKRADVVLAGLDRRTGADTYVVLELKQWSRAEIWEDDPRRSLVGGGASDQPVLHPMLQAKSYRDYIVDFIPALADRPDAVHAVTYLYDVAPDDVADLHDAAEDSRARLFTAATRGAFLEYLRRRFAAQPGRQAGDRLLQSKVRPSKQLLKLAGEEIRNREQFTLLDEQRLAYELVLHAVQKARLGDQKTIVVVTGGPGSGKSTIGLSLLGNLSRQGLSVAHATGSRAFTQTMRRYVARGSSQTKNLFKYFNSFIDAPKNGLDVLICDEAHRIRAVSSNRFTPASLRTDRPQVEELIDAARVPVFLLDEYQVVHPGEMGSLAQIRGHAEAKGLKVIEVVLNEQFRCGGSRKYEEWVLRLLGLAEGGPLLWTGDDRFKIILADSPNEMEAVLRGNLERGYSARITAGYCWPWSDPRDHRTLVPDVAIGDWARPWSVKGERAVGTAPPSALWSTMDGGFEQVGSVYTAQGFEYDWNGVIIGPDLVYREGRLVTVRGENHDPALRRRTVTDEAADRLVRNIYKVLFTRGMVGTIIYSTDRETQQFLRTAAQTDVPIG
ncbi:DNA/RNA helicase domain-containing protein [Actinoallomurus sp. CA-150999]|uniref:DNA/RNA helicase domain-containing protein n=1 Tax=Actinoallomurus sp. CA-150999 TaxID=3239887 RepID=UPI003D8DDC5A